MQALEDCLFHPLHQALIADLKRYFGWTAVDYTVWASPSAHMNEESLARRLFMDPAALRDGTRQDSACALGLGAS